MELTQENRNQLENALDFSIYLTNGVENFIDMLEYVLQLIDIPNDKSKSYYDKRDFTRNLLANLLIGYNNNLPIKYSRDRNKWCISSRYDKLYLKYDIMIEIIDKFIACGLINQSKGYLNHDDKIGRLTRMWSTEQLVNLYIQFDLLSVKYMTSDEPYEVVILKSDKDDKGNCHRILYKDTERVKRIRDKVRKYNDFAKKYSVEIDCKDIELCEKDLDTIMKYTRYGKISNLTITPCEKFANDLDLNNLTISNYNSINNTTNISTNSLSTIPLTPISIPLLSHYTTNLLPLSYTVTHTNCSYDVSMLVNYLSLRRVFVRQKFSFGGRFYTSVYQNLPKELRSGIYINDEPTIELDYSGLHIRMLYHMIGIDYREDCYRAICENEEDRQLMKMIMLVAINTKKRTGIPHAVQKDFRKNGIPYPDQKTIMDYVDKFCEYHKPISHFVGSDMGIKLQFRDSCIMDDILQQGMKDNILILPIHDSCIFQVQHYDYVMNLMNEMYKKSMGFYPVIKPTKIKLGGNST